MKKNILIILVISSIIIVSGCKKKTPLTKNEKFLRDSTTLVDVKEAIPDIIVDVRYATKDNMSGMVLYPTNKCYIQKTTAEKLKRAQTSLKKMKIGLKIFDGYRPVSIQDKMWKLVPDDRLVANRENGDKHSRGASVDVTLVKEDGKELNLGSMYDAFSSDAERYYEGIPADAKIFRVDILTQVMLNSGFSCSTTQWWHFDDTNWEHYKPLNYPLK